MLALAVNTMNCGVSLAASGVPFTAGAVQDAHWQSGAAQFAGLQLYHSGPMPAATVRCSAA